jgi:RNA polymerase sigma-70 factor (ECF subfamily)
VAADRADLAAALAALPVDLRAVVLLVDAEGMDYRTAGEVIGIPPGTVGTRLMRARAQLRRSPALDRSDERTTQEGG